MRNRCIEIPLAPRYWLLNASVPASLAPDFSGKALEVDLDAVQRVDIEVNQGRIQSIQPAEGPASSRKGGVPAVNLRGSMVFPTFVDLHTHIDKGHTGERSRNPNGSLSGADRSTARDAAFWDKDDVYRRMDFSIKCAYAHGTSALRTHLINMTPKQLELTWPVFSALRKKWAGKVELQGVSLVALSFFRNEANAKALADTVAEHGGVLGAAVCCAENGGDLSDDWTTCPRDRSQLLDRMFVLAKERNLDVDFHVDENGNERAKGLLYVAEKTIQHSYQGRVVCGHCCSLAAQPPKQLQKILATVQRAGITVVSLPLVNEWTQDRAHAGGRTPRWRGITLLHELKAAGIPVALASDNTRDQFYAYGDLDMLEVFTQSCRIGHLDRPYGDWPTAVCSAPADAMKLLDHGRLQVEGPANLIIFRGRRYSEVLARPQYDRVVVRDGVAIQAEPPDYQELDYVPRELRLLNSQREEGFKTDPHEGADGRLGAQQRFASFAEPGFVQARSSLVSWSLAPDVQLALLALIMAGIGCQPKADLEIDSVVAKELNENGFRSTRRTKIICTIGPTSCSSAMLQTLADNGMNVARLNMCHGTREWHTEVIKRIRQLNAEKGYSVAIMLDTEGSEVHLNEIPEPIKAEVGEEYVFTIRDPSVLEGNAIGVSYDAFIDDVQVGDLVVVDGGMVSLEVISKAGPDVVTKVEDPGIILSRANVTLRRHGEIVRARNAMLPVLSSKDWLDVDFAISQKVDFIAVSFVKTADVINNLKSYVVSRSGKPIEVIAKVESYDSVPNIQEIIEASDAVMVARGDLGAQIPLEDVPSVQKEVVMRCRQMGKPVIVASHLLQSMIEYPTPTRAEVADIADVVRQRADALMLSGESAVGAYPDKAVQVLRQVATRIEEWCRQEKHGQIVLPQLTNLPDGRVSEELCASAAMMATNLNARAIFVYTRRGYMANFLARCRPDCPIFAFTDNQEVRQRMNLRWGVMPFRLDFSNDPEFNVDRTFKLLKARELVNVNDLVVVVSDIRPEGDKSVVRSVQIRRVP
ncbi:hypothetical protein WJX72_000267 [[Myrmecia] bisecta]|uniref:Pyruvate kinase n=1 Tax=[Myrmecia] bisecta TaxID=41462 RepID=A0AAW1QA00_9CHLO